MTNSLSSDNSIFIRQLSEGDKFTLSKLRRDAFADNFSEEAQTNIFNWGPSDRSAFVYGLFVRDQLASTLRLEIVTSPEVFKTRLLVTPAEVSAQLPTAVTSRGATGAKYRGQGFYSALRFCCLLKALRLGFTDCFSTYFKVTARKERLQEPHCELFSKETFTVKKISLEPQSFFVLQSLYDQNKGLIQRIRGGVIETLMEEYRFLLEAKPSSIGSGRQVSHGQRVEEPNS